ncbi:hypothetical protein CYJ70_06300 [Gardnerella pickettii]|uniref:Cell division protein n=1 Tax=Gardnerella pickettii TaxID=2914924 RepID=A0ABX4SG03_9BIFI|nr:hypothetical protein [Gardnerella pickettii]EIK86303.1 hypothetical protein CGSMWGv00703C2mash_01959 [Gardnerella pickettii 00703C2mash]PKZ52863.1 hypothetical protein CYJ70_06300 [Gardnerella pickettii]
MSENEDDTMESQVSANRSQKLPLNPVIANNDDSPSAAFEAYDAVPAASKVNDDASDAASDSAAAGDSAVAGDEAANSAVAGDNAQNLFPMPDLREREDGGAIAFDDEEENVFKAADPQTVSEEVRTKSREEFTTVYDIIDTMETALNSAKGVLFAAGMAKVDREEFGDYLSRLKDMLPVQLERASALMREAERRLRTAQAQANSVVSSAQSQAAQMVEEAQERARFLAGQENVVAIAKNQAREIVSNAQAKAEKLTRGADQYSATVMEGLKQQLDKLEQDVQAGQRVLEERRRAAAHVQNQAASKIDEEFNSESSERSDDERN